MYLIIFQPNRVLVPLSAHWCLWWTLLADPTPDIDEMQFPHTQTACLKLSMLNRQTWLPATQLG